MSHKPSRQGDEWYCIACMSRWDVGDDPPDTCVPVDNPQDRPIVKTRMPTRKRPRACFGFKDPMLR